MLDCDHPTEKFTLTAPTVCEFKVLGKIDSTGHSMDEVYLPMLTRVDSGAIIWQPPQDLKATGGGAVKTGNLIANPGFEEGLAHWTRISGDANVLETDPFGANIIPHSGTRMLFIGAKSETFEIHGSVLHVSLWYTNAALSRTLHVQMVFDNGTPQDLIKLWPTDPLKIWKRYTATIKVPPNTTKASLIINTDFGRIDDVEVTEEI